MKKKIILLCLVIGVLNASSVSANFNSTTSGINSNLKSLEKTTEGNYTIQWQMDYGSDWGYGARYEGPQPIGDSDNDGKNELLISGRDCMIRVMEWNENTNTYNQTHSLRPPLYPLIRCDAGGMAIGDVNNDGKNEIAATWYSALYKYSLGRYKIFGLNSWIFRNGGGNPDCLIGDCDNDGKNEVIMSAGPLRITSSVPPIVILKWNGWRLAKVASWDDLGIVGLGYVYMAGLGDVDYDEQNEIVCACKRKVFVLNWDKDQGAFNSTIILGEQHVEDLPFGCVCKDCDGDGKSEILISYYAPHITILKWNGTGYETQFDVSWPGGDPVIEGIDAGDADDDGIPEVCAGAGVTHILQWNGTSYVEETVLPTYGSMAVVSIGDCDNDGLNEINAGNVDVNFGQSFMEWVFKYSN